MTLPLGSFSSLSFQAMTATVAVTNAVILEVVTQIGFRFFLTTLTYHSSCCYRKLSLEYLVAISHLMLFKTS
jgi:hypothetical protein